MPYLSASVGQQAVISAKVARPQPGHVQGKLRCQALPALRRKNSFFSFMWHMQEVDVGAASFACQVMITCGTLVRACSRRHASRYRLSALLPLAAAYVGAEAGAVPAVSRILLISAMADENNARCRAVNSSRPVHGCRRILCICRCSYPPNLAIVYQYSHQHCCKQQNWRPEHYIIEWYGHE